MANNWDGLILRDYEGETYWIPRSAFLKLCFTSMGGGTEIQTSSPKQRPQIQEVLDRLPDRLGCRNAILVNLHLKDGDPITVRPGEECPAMLAGSKIGDVLTPLMELIDTRIGIESKKARP